MAEVIGTLFDAGSSELLIERFEDMMSSSASPARYPGLGLAQRQRFASKGGNIVRFAMPTIANRPPRETGSCPDRWEPLSIGTATSQTRIVMTSTQVTFALLLANILGLTGVVAADAAPPATADQVTVQQLQNQVDALDGEFTRLKSATVPEAQNQIMQRHWGMLLDHLRSTRIMPGIGDAGCTDWMMMDSNVIGPGMMGSGGSMGCGILGHGTVVASVAGNGMRDWKLPSSMMPEAYQRRMQEPMHGMHQQMAAIAAEKDPVKRQALIREHYDTMYRDIQMTRGMGWMWTRDEAAPVLADPSPQAQLVVKYCSQCHATPPPSVHTQGEWLQVTSRMRGHIYDRAAAWGGGVKVPDVSELEKIEDYLVTTAARVR